MNILVVCCSIFNPTPSLSAMLVNHFKLRRSVLTYNLSGMGCSAGLIAVSLVRELLQVRLRYMHGLAPKYLLSTTLVVLSKKKKRRLAAPWRHKLASRRTCSSGVSAVLNCQCGRYDSSRAHEVAYPLV